MNKDEKSLIIAKVVSMAAWLILCFAPLSMAFAS